ncbi:hypothetical protein BDZ89DRAFT_371409 [Hymenopellis radicata]|nr:hypothetical protein BDZ89DRAFT_371409 [Hymenopellis radicata]
MLNPHGRRAQLSSSVLPGHHHTLPLSSVQVIIVFGLWSHRRRTRSVSSLSLYLILVTHCGCVLSASLLSPYSVRPCRRSLSWSLCRRHFGPRCTSSFGSCSWSLSTSLRSPRLCRHAVLVHGFMGPSYSSSRGVVVVVVLVILGCGDRRVVMVAVLGRGARS